MVSPLLPQQLSAATKAKGKIGSVEYLQPRKNIPTMHWKNNFHKTREGTKVEVEITFAEKEDLQKIIEMGFEAGLQRHLKILMSF